MKRKKVKTINSAGLGLVLRFPLEKENELNQINRRIKETENLLKKLKKKREKLMEELMEEK
jgi:ppGpp synthetase/RelA/SpoT-type nucleotidyltranferase